MGTILKGATLVDLEPASVERADLRIDGPSITARAPSLEAQEGDEVIDLSGHLILPGMVSAHHRLSARFARGLGRPFGRAALEDALDGDAVELAASAGALEALQAGTTTVIDRLVSPAFVRGSLARVARGVEAVGLRAALSWEVTDRAGEDVREDALVETVAFHHQHTGHRRFRALLGAAGLHELSDEALEGLVQAAQAIGVPLSVTLAETPEESRLCVERYGKTPLARLLEREGLLDARSLVAHAVHLSWPELSQVLGTGAWLVHTPVADAERGEGYAPAGKFGARAALGTAGQGADLFAEARWARLRAQDAGQPVSVLRMLANGHRIASELFGETIGPLAEGAVADLLVLDYRPLTPLDAGTLEAHLTQGMGARDVVSVMVDGTWRLWGRRPVSVSPELLAEHAAAAAHALWARLPELPGGAEEPLKEEAAPVNTGA